MAVREKITALNFNQARAELADQFAARQAANATLPDQVSPRIDQLYGLRQREGLPNVLEIELRLLSVRLKQMLEVRTTS